MRTALRDFTCEDIWFARRYPQFFTPSMADRRFERLSEALTDELARREAMTAWLAATESPALSTDPAAPPTSDAGGHPTPLAPNLSVLP